MASGSTAAQSASATMEPCAPVRQGHQCSWGLSRVRSTLCPGWSGSLAREFNRGTRVRSRERTISGRSRRTASTHKEMLTADKGREIARQVLRGVCDVVPGFPCAAWDGRTSRNREPRLARGGPSQRNRPSRRRCELDPANGHRGGGDLHHNALTEKSRRGPLLSM